MFEFIKKFMTCLKYRGKMAIYILDKNGNASMHLIEDWREVFLLGDRGYIVDRNKAEYTTIPFVGNIPCLLYDIDGVFPMNSWSSREISDNANLLRVL